MSNDRDELERSLVNVLSNAMNYPDPVAMLGKDTGPLRKKVVDAVLAAGFRNPRTITTHSELAEMPDGTVIVGPDGLVGEKRDWPLDLAVRYVNGTQEANADIPLPALVLWTPEAES